jgi:hypothetical protein
MYSPVVLVLSIVLITACASNKQRDEVVPTGNVQIEFIDLDSFDMTMTRDLQRGADLVQVRFPNQPITVNELPERLKKWLNAVHKNGQGFTVESTDGYVQKDILSLVGVLVSGYKMVKSNMPAIVSREYKAVITLNKADGVIEKVDFIRL